MNFVVLTIFPELLQAFWENGIMRRAVDSGTIRTQAINIRDHAKGRHRVTDDRPYGGGCGMVMKPEPLTEAIREARKAAPNAVTIALSPQGRPLDQAAARELAACEALILVCGRYEGIDDRVNEQSVDMEISIGDYVLTGGELPAMVLMDAVTRLIPGALGNETSADQDSFCSDRLDHAHFTPSARIRGHGGFRRFLLSGHHEMVSQWAAGRRIDANPGKAAGPVAGIGFGQRRQKAVGKVAP